ncbi:MAG: hypothetical protein PHT69_05195 [Bacteroidales bacterium]|nr:hypothetical protein [Bacteroidales bacterium]
MSLCLSSSRVKDFTKAAYYEVLGNLPMDCGLMKISLHIITPQNQQKHRLKVDLYDNNNVENILNQIAIKDNTVNINEVEVDFIVLTDLLENHREKLFNEEAINRTNIDERKELTPIAQKQAIEFLKRPNLLERIDKLLEQSGIIGEQQVRLILFIIASSYKMPYTLHALIQGESGGGKTHLINAISECMPAEDVSNLSRITSKSFYYYTNKELVNKLILVQDIHGLDEEAQYAFRELQSSGSLCSSTTEKDRFGILKSKIKYVKAHFASLVTTSNADVYYDNMSRSIILGIDESISQTNQIITYQNQKLSGIICDKEEEQAKQLLRNCIRILKPCEVINPYTEKIIIPVETQMKRRLNQQFQSYIAQITILNQYQRKRDEIGRLITTLDDVISAIETFFPALFLKIDELNSSTRQFFERLKKWVKQHPTGTNYKFSERDGRHGLQISKTSLHEHFKMLKELEYIQVVDGSVNRGFKYQICFWDDVEKLKTKIQAELSKQIAEIAVSLSEKRTPEHQ